MLVAVAGRYTVTNFEGMGSEDLLDRKSVV